METKDLNKITYFYMALLTGISIVLGILHWDYYGMKSGGIYWFNLDKERNITTWFSGALFFFFALASFLAFYTERNRNKESFIFRFPALWILTGLTGLLMSLDEITILHENLFWIEVRELSEIMGNSWVYLTQWQLVFAPIIILIFSYFVLFFSNRFASSRRAIVSVSAGLGCWILALFLEGIRGTFKFYGKLPYRIEVLIEEELEMLGAIFLIMATVFYTIDIAVDLTADRMNRIRQSSKFLARKIFKSMAIVAAVFFLMGSLISFFAQKQAVDSTPVSSLFEKAKRMKAAQEKTPKIWFDDIKIIPSVTTLHKKELAKKIIDKIINIKNISRELTFPPLKKERSPALVFLSASDGNTPARVAFGSGRGLVHASTEALKQIGNLYGAGFDPVWVKVDFVDEVEKTNVIDLKLLSNLDRGIKGIAFEKSVGAAFLPEEIISRALVNKKKKINLERMVELQKKRLVSSRPLNILRGARSFKVYTFSTTSFFSDGKDFVELYRGHRLFPKLSRENLLNAAVWGGKYLARSVMPNGKFIYSYKAHKDEVRDKYNILRHAGTLYSMLELYEVTKDTELLKAIKRGIKYLMESSRPSVKNKKNALSIVEKNSVKLGGNALAAVAVSKYIEVTGDSSYIPVLRKLGNGMLNLQNQKGTFTHKISYPDGKAKNFISEYYPGEAILGLLRIYKLDRKDTWLDASEKEAQYLINVRDRDVPISKLIHDHWLLYGLNELYQYRKKDIYLDHAKKIVTAILNKQNKNPRFLDWTGSYYVPPRSTPTATRSEGLCAAYNLFKEFQPSPENNEILEAVKAGIRFQMQTQFRPESVMYLKNPVRSLGGFHRSLTNFEIRIDYVQHNISSLLCLYNINKPDE